MGLCRRAAVFFLVCDLPMMAESALMLKMKSKNRMVALHFPNFSTRPSYPACTPQLMDGGAAMDCLCALID